MRRLSQQSEPAQRLATDWVEAELAAVPLRSILTLANSIRDSGVLLQSAAATSRFETLRGTVFLIGAEDHHSRAVSAIAVSASCRTDACHVSPNRQRNDSSASKASFAHKFT